ncbi:hypothetical protein KIN34_02440 [Cellulomonas sp. DKR-3]|uniref:ApeA N-terminal domain-containing protein n=2 Tax=Cellulomonas fulva TaxID=2835530 RepID=A0ABS5TVG7_9CELL|nr:hypothetical protein [Cellulomonas fulva]
MFDGERFHLFGDDPNFPSILQGRVMKEAVTLVGARVTAQRGALTEQRDATVTADYALEGFGVFEPAELMFTDVRLRFTDQDTWTGWNRFAVMAHDRLRISDFGAVLRDVPEAEARIEGGKLSLVDGSYANQEHDTHRWVLQSRSWFDFHFDEAVTIGEVFARYAYPLQVMLMSASGRLPGVVSIAGTNTAWDFGDGSDLLPSRWLQVRRFHGPLDTPRVSDLQYLHRLRDLDFGVHMPALLKAVERHRFALGHYGLLRSDRFVGGHPVRFSVATQLIDAFDRTLHPQDTAEPAFDARLKRLENESGNLVDGIIGTRKWRGEVGRLRNIVVHGDAYAHEVLRDQRPLVVGYEALLLLFEVRFLVEIGLSPEEATSLATGRVHHWTIEKAITENYPALSELIKRDHQRRRHRKTRP